MYTRLEKDTHFHLLKSRELSLLLRCSYCQHPNSNSDNKAAESSTTEEEEGETGRKERKSNDLHFCYFKTAKLSTPQFCCTSDAIVHKKRAKEKIKSLCDCRFNAPIKRRQA
jgi:hypothetical protein